VPPASAWKIGSGTGLSITCGAGPVLFGPQVMVETQVGRSAAKGAACRTRLADLPG